MAWKARETFSWVLFPRLGGFATGSSNLHFSMVQKVTFDIVACGLESPVKPSAGCCFPVSQGLQQAPPTFIFLWFRR